MTEVTAGEIAGLDRHKFKATLGKRVIHAGGRKSTDALLRHAAHGSGRTLPGPFRDHREKPR